MIWILFSIAFVVYTVWILITEERVEQINEIIKENPIDRGVTMFEKEAEGVCSKYFEENCYKKNKWADTHDLVTMWQDGYNKANEWHKPNEKLPEECSLVLAYGFEDSEPSLYYFVASDTWEWMPRRIAVLSNEQIRLWKEIVPPKESE